MADFSKTQIQPLQSAVTPPSPVEDVSGIVSTQAMAQGFGNALNILGGVINRSRSKSAEEASGQVLVGFTEELGRIDNALQQGSISNQEASARKRTALITYSANNPTMSSDLRTTYTSLEGKAGFGQATPEQKAREDSLEKAYSLGFVSDSMSPQERERGLQNYNSITREQFELKQAQERLSYAKSELDLNSSQMRMEEERYNMKMRSALPSFGNAFFDQVQLGVNKVLGELSSNVDGNQMAVRKLQQMKADYQRQSSQFAIGADETTRSSIKSVGTPIEQMIDDAIQVANGTMSKQVFDNAVSSNSSKSLLMLGSRDPRIWNIIGTSEFSSDLANIISLQTPGLMNNMLDAVSNPASVNITSPNSELAKPYYDGLTSFTNRVASDQVPPSRKGLAQTELAERSNGVLNSIHHNSSVYTSGPEMKPTVAYLASDTFRQHVKSGKMDSAAAEKALRVVQQTYQTDLMPQIEKVLSSNPEQFLGKMVAGAAGAEAFRAGAASARPESAGSVRDMVEWGWNGSGVMFRPSQSGDPRVNKIAAERLNKEVAPLINQSTKAIAHLQGIDSYESVFNEQIGPNIGLMDGEQPTEANGETAPLAKGDRLKNKPEPAQPPSQRVQGAFEAVDDMEVALEASREAVQSDLAPVEGSPTGDGEMPSNSAPEPLNLKQGFEAVQMSNDQILKAAREKLISEGIDEEDITFNAFLTREYRIMKREMGANISKAAIGHADGSTKSGPAAKIPKGEVVAYIADGLQERGIPQHIAEGFLLNFQDESGFNPGINEKNPIVPGSRGGYGLYQLTGPRRKQYEAYAKAVGKPVDDIDTQLDFLLMELESSESAAASKIFRAKTRGDAAAAIVEHFLRPAKSHKESRVKRYLNS
jgi:hypothetical protein